MTELAQLIKFWQETIDHPHEVRTLKQNNSLQKGLRNLCEELEEGGLDMKKVLKPEVDIPWTVDSAREFLFNPIAQVMFNRTSSELNTVEIQKVWDVMMRHMGEKHGVTVPWPDRFNGGGRE